MKQMTLSETIPGKQYLVEDIKDEARLVNRLSSMGVMCGSQVEICQNHKKQPVLVFQEIHWLPLDEKKAKRYL